MFGELLVASRLHEPGDSPRSRKKKSALADANLIVLPAAPLAPATVAAADLMPLTSTPRRPHGGDGAIGNALVVGDANNNASPLRQSVPMQQQQQQQQHVATLSSIASALQRHHDEQRRAAAKAAQAERRAADLAREAAVFAVFGRDRGPTHARPRSATAAAAPASHGATSHCFSSRDHVAASKEEPANQGDDGAQTTQPSPAQTASKKEGARVRPPVGAHDITLAASTRRMLLESEKARMRKARQADLAQLVESDISASGAATAAVEAEIIAAGGVSDGRATSARPAPCAQSTGTPTAAARMTGRIGSSARILKQLEELQAARDRNTQPHSPIHALSQSSVPGVAPRPAPPRAVSAATAAATRLLLDTVPVIQANSRFAMGSARLRASNSAAAAASPGLGSSADAAAAALDATQRKSDVPTSSPSSPKKGLTPPDSLSNTFGYAGNGHAVDTDNIPPPAALSPGRHTARSQLAPRLERLDDVGVGGTFAVPQAGASITAVVGSPPRSGPRRRELPSVSEWVRGEALHSARYNPAPKTVPVVLRDDGTHTAIVRLAEGAPLPPGAVRMSVADLEAKSSSPPHGRGRSGSSTGRSGSQRAGGGGLQNYAAKSAGGRAASGRTRGTPLSSPAADGGGNSPSGGAATFAAVPVNEAAVWPSVSLAGTGCRRNERGFYAALRSYRLTASRSARDFWGQNPPPPRNIEALLARVPATNFSGRAGLSG